MAIQISDSTGVAAQTLTIVNVAAMWLIPVNEIAKFGLTILGIVSSYLAIKYYCRKLKEKNA